MKLDPELVHWHLEQGRAAADVQDFFAGLGPELQRCGIPVDRMMFGTFVPHPQLGGALYRWRHEDEAVWKQELSREFFIKSRYIPSPFQVLRTTCQPFHTATSPAHAMELVQNLHHEGYTDVYALPYLMDGQFQGGITFATRRAGGFSAHDLQRLLAQHSAFCAVIEPKIRESVMRQLLRFYLGAGAGERVYRGQVHRGEGTRIPAAIWFSDLRGFTAASERLSPEDLLTLLNDVFEVLIDAVQAHGGEVLKLIGDGMMAIFEGDGGAEASIRAARTAQQALSELRQRRQAADLHPPEVGIGLHYGEVMYGNIGGKTRLDFTVIGTAVNRTARLEGLCGALSQRVLVSQALSERVDTELIDLGEHSVKGVPEPMKVYALPRDPG